MPVIISLLRGINVGGNHLVRMEALRELYASLGCGGVQTLLQSGNVVFTARESNQTRLSGQIKVAIAKKFGFAPEIIHRTLPEWQTVIAQNPFAHRTEINPSRLLVIFLATEAPGDTAKRWPIVHKGPEEISGHGRELYIHFRDGMGRSKLTHVLIEKTVQTSGTARNWNTVLKLRDMAEAVRD